MTTVNEFLNLLAFLFEKGFEYSSTNGHRSAISAYHMQINNNPIGKHPRVWTLMTGIFNKRSPKPRFIFIWDTKKVLNHLNELVNLNLLVNLLSQKLALLLALTVASRG